VTRRCERGGKRYNNARRRVNHLRASAAGPCEVWRAAGEPSGTIPAGTTMRLADRYRLLRRVGEGGGGGVFLVEDRLADGAVMVLKRLHAQAQGSLAQWIVNEFQVLAQLDLPTVARVYDFGLASADAEDPGGVFFTRAYVEGAALDDALAQAPADRVRRAFVSVAGTLRELHRLGVVHGDLKPANLLLARDGDRPTLIDFGLAHGAMGAAAHIRGGTLGFMPPERQAALLAGESLPPDPRADVYGLAVTLRCVLAGALVGPEAPAPERVATDPELRALWEVSARGVAPDPARRIGTMDDLLAAFGHGLDARAASGRVVLRPEGREQELGALLDAVSRRLIQRESGVPSVLVVGEEGSGRSTALRELTWRAQIRGVQVLPVACAPGELPARRLREGAGILAGQPVDPAAPDALVTAFRKAAAAAPVLILADDLDRADPAIAAQLRSIAYGCDVAEALLVVATAAADAGVRDFEPASRIELPPLSAEAVAALCAQSLGPVEPAVAAAVHRRTGGLPLAVTEVLAALACEGAVSPADVERIEVVGRAHEVAARRALALRHDARVAAAAVAALGGHATGEALGLAEVARDHLEAAREAGAITAEAGDRWQLTHRSMATALLDALAPSARTELLRRVAAALDRSGAPATARCEAWTRAGDVARALALLPEAVSSLRAEALPLAAARLMEALRVQRPEVATDRALYEEAELLFDGGMVAEAELLARRVGEGDRELGLKARLLRGRLLRVAGDNEGAERLLDGLAAEASEREPDLAAEATVEGARAAMARGDYQRVLARCEEAAAQARGPKTRAAARALGGVAACYAGDAARGAALLEAARGDYASLALPREEASLLVYLAVGRERAGDLPGARALHEQSLERARAAGDLRAMVTARLNLGHIAQRLGDLGAALQHNEAALRLARRAGVGTVIRTAHLNLASELIHIGSLDRARAELDVALTLARSAGARDVAAAATQMLGVVVARGGDVDRGVALIAEAEAAYRELGIADDAADCLLDAAEMLFERGTAGDDARALERVARARAGGDLGLREARARVLEARGALPDARAAMARLGDAVATAEGTGDWEVLTQALAVRAEAHDATGAALHARRDRERAVEVLEEKAALLPPDLRGAFWALPRRAALREALGEPASDRDLGAAARRPWGGASVMGARLPTGNTQLPTVLAPDERLPLLLELSRRLGEEHALERVLDQAARSALEFARAERAAILLAGEGGRLDIRVRVGAVAGDGPDEEVSRSIADSVWIDGEPVVTLDARIDRRFAEFRSVHALGVAAVAAVPLRAGGRTLGVLYVESRRRKVAWSPGDVALLAAFAEQAGLAVEHARLVESLETRTRELESARREIERLLDERTEELAATRSSLTRAHEALARRFTPDGVVAHTEAMRKVFALIDRVRDSDVAVVVEGESGTGKEIVARSLHFSGARARGPFMVVHCGAIPETLMESELFGHVKGAFTGADRDRKGLIASAHGGTLFLDEVGEMSPRMQVELLRVLQDRRVRPVGSEREEAVDIRVVAAARRPLTELVAEGRFREDLYYRLGVVTVRIPPLRERLDDIPALATHFLGEFAREQGGARRRLSREALAKLLRAAWPGNVRQLRHALENAAVLCEGDTIEAELLRVGEAEVAAPTFPAAPSAAPSPMAVRKAAERQKILDALEFTNWNKVKAAEHLGMPRRTLYRRLEEFGLLE
jgi:serine/threonine-protein kinase PknK